MFPFNLQMMDTMHNKCALVHGDLSEYNLLWYQEKVWMIDVSQSVELTHPKAMEFLFRDCCNVCKVVQGNQKIKIKLSFPK